MRYYIVNNQGEVLGEDETFEKAEMKMHLRFSQSEIDEQEIEVVEGD